MEVFLIFLTGATMDFQGMPDWIGHLCTPLSPKFSRTSQTIRPYAIDNGCYASKVPFNLEKYLSFVSKLMAVANRPPLFTAAPDIVGDHLGTWRLTEPVLPGLRSIGARPALVCQDGLTAEAVPWDAIDALFIGGTTRWKMGHEVVKICQEAKLRRTWIHVGRVNNSERIRHCHELLRADSIDGNAAAMNPRRIWEQIGWMKGLDYKRVPLWT
jgi:hypothetical protein